MTATTKSTQAQAATQIKTILKREFPGIAFSVRSESFSGGDSVHVSWNLGPTSEQVNKLISRYQYGHFDGMIDCYEYSNCHEDIPQTKFVCAQRDYRTQEEIDNYDLKWNDPARRDLWKEEKTLYHIIARDLCKLAGIEYRGLAAPAPDDFKHMAPGFGCPDFQAIINHLLYGQALMTGYHGVKRALSDDGTEIINSFIIY